MVACGPLPSAWVLLCSHHPTEWDGTVCVLLMRTPKLLEGQGTCQSVEKWRNHAGQDTRSCAQVTAQLPLHTPEPILEP